MHKYQQLNLKNKLRKQTKQEQNNRYGEHFEGYQLEGRRGRGERKMRGLRSTNG